MAEKLDLEGIRESVQDVIHGKAMPIVLLGDAARLVLAADRVLALADAIEFDAPRRAAQIHRAVYGDADE